MKPEIVSAEREAELRRRAHVLLDAAPCADMIIPVPEAAALLDELAELRATLLAERGDPAGALPGWAWTTEDGRLNHHEWQRPVPTTALAAGVWRGDDRWHWQAHPSGGSQQGSAPTARAAMIAADASLTPASETTP